MESLLCSVTWRRTGRLAEEYNIVPAVVWMLQEVCYQYWPSRGSKAFGEFRVELVREEKLAGIIIRNIIVINKKVQLKS